MWDGFNKRKFPRLNLKCQLILKRPSPSAAIIHAQTENVGAGGVAMLLERALERFSVLHIRVELDPSLPWIECEGKVVWVVPSRDQVSKIERFDTGIEFQNLQPAAEDLVRQYVNARMEGAKVR